MFKLLPAVRLIALVCIGLVRLRFACLAVSMFMMIYDTTTCSARIAYWILAPSP